MFFGGEVGQHMVIDHLVAQCCMGRPPDANPQPPVCCAKVAVNITQSVMAAMTAINLEPDLAGGMVYIIKIP